MISHRRHSTSVANDYQKKKHHQNEHNPRIRSKSDSFFQEDFDNIDFQYLYSKNLKSNRNVVSKVPLIEIKFQTKANLTKSFSSDSIKENFSNKNKNNTKSTNLMRNSLSCYNLQSLLNGQHNLYSIHGIPCFIKSIQKVDYSQYISLEYQKDLTNFDSIEFFNRDDRINEREVSFIQKYRKIRYFFRNRNNQKNAKKNRKNESNTKIDSPPQKPRFNLYFSKSSTPLQQKKSINNQSPRLSSAFILNEKYNIRSRVFKENNIRKFYKELAAAEEDDKHFVFDFEKKRSRSVEKNSLYRTVTLKKVKRSKSTQHTIDYRKYFIKSSSSSPEKLKNRPRFKLFSPRNSSRPISKNEENENHSPKPSSASVLNGKYNIRSRLFKEMHIHEFYKNLAAAEEEEKVKNSLKQVQMLPRSKKIVENYMQRINQTESKNKDKHSQSEIDNQSIPSNQSQKMSQIIKSDLKSEESNSSKQSQSTKNYKNLNSKLSQNGNDNQSIKSNQNNDEINLQSEESNLSPTNNDNKSNSSKQSHITKNYKNLNSKLSQNGNDNQSIKSNQSNAEINLQSEESNLSPTNNDNKSNSSKQSQSTKNYKNLNSKLSQNGNDNQSIKSNQNNVESDLQSEDCYKKESEEINPPKIKKFYRKVPGFISSVSNFLDEYNISIRYDSEKSNTKQKRKRKKI